MSDTALRSLKTLGIGPLFSHRLWGTARLDESFARLWPSTKFLLISNYGRLWGYVRGKGVREWRQVATSLYPTFTENDAYPMWLLAKILTPTPHLYYADALIAFAHLSAPPPAGPFDIAHRDADLHHLAASNLHYLPAPDSHRTRLLRQLYDARALAPNAPTRTPASLRLPPPDELEQQRQDAALYILTYWRTREGELPTLDELLASITIARPFAILELSEAAINLRRIHRPYPDK